MLTFKFRPLGYGPAVKVGLGNQEDRVRGFGPYRRSKIGPTAFDPTPRRVDRARLGNLGPKMNLTGEQDRWHGVEDGTTVQKHQC